MVLKPHDLGRLTGKVKEIIVLTVLKESRLRGKQSYSLTPLTSTDFDTALGNAEPVTNIDDETGLAGRTASSEVVLGTISGGPCTVDSQ